MKRAGSSRRAMTVLVAAFVIAAAILGLLVLQKYRNSRLQPAEPPKVEEAGTLLVTLFFAAPDGTGLVREGREIDACTDPAECAEEVVEELINGPVGESSPTLPPTAAIRSVTVNGETAVVDFGMASAGGISGSHGEMMAFYSVVNSLAFNFPHIRSVKFLFEGEKVASLGHLDLSEPLAPDFTLEKK